MTSYGTMAQIERLTGRDNYATWAFAVKSYLQHEDLWIAIENDGKGEIDKSLDVKAKSKIILLVDPINYVHIQDAKTAKGVWKCLEVAFQDSGLARKVGLLRELITTDLESCGNVENYVSKIMTSAHKLRNVGFKVDDEWLGTLLLAGLPETQRPMIMAMESSGVKITADYVKTKILQEVNNVNDSNAFYTNTKNKYSGYKQQAKGPRCYKCNKYGHIAKFCTQDTHFDSNNHRKLEKDNAGASSYVAAFSATPNFNWVLDSGAGMHMTNNKDWLYEYGPASVSSIKIADNKTLDVKGCGNVDIKSYDSNTKLFIGKIKVTQVLYVPELAVNLLSVTQITNNGCEVKFTKDCCKIYKKSKLILTGCKQNNMYIVYNETYALLSCLQLWHQRLGHLNYQSLQKLNSSVEGVNMETAVLDGDVTCTTCIQGKQARLPFKHVGTRASALLEVIHTDVCGPMEEKSIGGARFYVTFIDDYSRKVFVYFMHTKAEVFEKFKEFKSLVENHLDRKIKNLRSDNGTEYVNNAFDNLLKESGIKRQLTVPYTPEQNGMSERMNRTLTERAKCMLLHSRLPKKFWAEAVSTAAYIINRSPTKSISYKTPEEIWTGTKPDISNMKIFGCKAMMHVPKEKRLKWDSKSKQLIFVGYCPESKGYRLFDKETSKILRSRDVVFLEDNLDNNMISVPIREIENESKLVDDSTLSEASSDTFQSISTMKDDNESICSTSDEEFVPSSKIKIDPPQPNSHPKLRPRKDGKVQTYICLNETEICTSEPDPASIEQALASENSQEWRKAMDTEFDSLIENNTWTLTDLPQSKTVIPCKWVYKSKEDLHGNIARYKARLVIKGYQQKYGIDYLEVFAPVVRMTSIRYLISMAAKYHLQIEQMDAVTAFLQGDIDVELYMSQPPHYDDGSGRVCRLNKSIYGLKQASRTWNLKLNNYLCEIGFVRSQLDPCVYFMNERADEVVFVAIYVDDLLLLYNNKEQVNRIKSKLFHNFKIKELGTANYYIGLRISYYKEGIAIDQYKYIEKILQRFKMEHCKPVGTPMEQGTFFNNTSEKVPQYVPYQEAIGCLLYLSQGTRPDICYSVHTLSRFNKSHNDGHWKAVKRVMRYLQSTKNLELFYKHNPKEEIIGYCDSDWASCMQERRSCTGYVFMHQNAAISWNSKRQPTIALSTTEAEYMALSAATQEAMWLRQLHSELWPTEVTPTVIFCDNQSCCKLSDNEQYHSRSKHIDVRHHYVREKVNCGEIEVKYVSTDDMPADCLTKALPKPKHLQFSVLMGLRSREDVEIMNATIS